MSASREKLLQYADEFYELNKEAFDESWTNLNYRKNLPQLTLVRAIQNYAPIRPEQEVPLLVYENRKVFGTPFVGFLLTEHALHYSLRKEYLGEIGAGKIELADINSLELLRNHVGLSNYNLFLNGNQLANLILYPEEEKALNAFFRGIVTGNFELPRENNSGQTRSRTVRDLMDPDKGIFALYKLVRDEAERLYLAFQPLLESAWVDKLDVAVMHDLRVILQICGYADKELDPREVFPFVYVAGRFSGDDSALKVFEELEGMPYEKAESIVCSLADSFYEWVHEVKGDDTFLLPPLLHQMDRRHRTDFFGPAIQAIYRFANVYVKADGMVKAEEEYALQQVWDMLHIKNRAD